MSAVPTPENFATTLLSAAATAIRQRQSAAGSRILNRSKPRTVVERFDYTVDVAMKKAGAFEDIPQPPHHDRGDSVTSVVLNRDFYCGEGRLLMDSFISQVIAADGFRSSLDLMVMDLGYGGMLDIARANMQTYYDQLPVKGGFCAGNMYVKEGGERALFEAFVKRGWRIMNHDHLVLLDHRNLPIAGVDLDLCRDRHYDVYMDDIQFFGLSTAVLDEITGILRSVLADRMMGNASMTTIQSIDKRGEMQTSTDDMSEGLTATSAFYPQMEGASIREYFMDFFNSKASVLIMYGPPGTAKSTMIRTAIIELGLRALGTSNPDVYANPNFISVCGSRMAGANGETPFDVLITEDAEALVAPRSAGNAKMAELLDATDGIGSQHKFKMIITLNSRDLSNVDTALLRPGRCFDIMEFGHLTAEEAMVVRRTLGMPEIAIKPGRYLLAEVVNMDDTKSETIDGHAIVTPRFKLKK